MKVPELVIPSEDVEAQHSFKAGETDGQLDGNAEIKVASNDVEIKVAGDTYIEAGKAETNQNTTAKAYQRRCRKQICRSRY